jgi:TP901 family phage tail tape measure protein
MASDKNNVEIKIQIVGVGQDVLKAITDSFSNLEKTVARAQEKLSSLGTSLKNLKVPSGFIESIKSLKQLNDIKAPNVDQLANGLKALMSTSFSGFNAKITTVVDGLRRLNNIKVPTVLQLANGLKILMSTSFSGFNLKINTVVEGLNRLVGIKAPNLLSLANGLKTLMSTSFSGFNLKITTVVNGLTRLVGINVPNLTSLANGLKKLVSIDVGTVAAKIRDLAKALGELDKQGFLKVFATFAKDLNSISAALGRATSAANKINSAFKDLGKTAQDSGLRVRTFADKVNTVLQFRLISSALIQVRNSITAGFSAIIDYSQALRDLQAITRATSLEVSQMGTKIIEIAATTKFSASEVAAGFRVIGQAGFSASESIETMQSVSDLATGTLSSMASTVDLVTTAMRVFNIESSRSNEVADVFANSVNRSKLTVDKLRTAMNFIGPVAKAAGVSFTELNAAMGTLANSGIRASTIGTGLRRIFAELVDPSKKLKKAAADAGVALADIDPRSASLTKVFQNLKFILRDTGTAFDLFGKRGAAAALALSNNPQAYKNMLDVISENGTAAKMAAIQMEGLGVAFKNLRDRLGNLAIALGNAGLTDVLHGLVSVLKVLIIGVTTLVNSAFGKFLIKVVAITASILLLMKAVLAVNAAFKGFLAVRAAAAATALIIPAAGGATVALSGLLAVLGPITVAVASVTLALGYMYKSFSKSKDASDSASTLATEYARLNKSVLDYRLSTVNLSADSKEYTDANKALRNELLKVGEGVGVVAEKARLAALSIDPLTGKINENGAALEDYRKTLESFETKELIKALKLAGDNLDKQTSAIGRWVDRWKSAFGTVGVYVKSFGAQINAFLNGDIEKIPGMWVKAWKDASKRGAAIELATDFAKALSKGKKSFDELAEYANELNAKLDITSSEQSILDAFELINEKATKVFDRLQSIGKLDARNTIDEVKAMAKEFNLTDLEMGALLSKFKDLQIQSADSLDVIIEKWGKQGDQIESVNKAVEYYKSLGGVIDEQNKKDYEGIIQNAKARQELIVQLNKYKAILSDELSGAGEDIEAKRRAYNSYFTERNRLVEEANKISKNAAKNDLEQQIAALNRITKIRDDNLRTNEIKNENSVRIQEEERIKIIAEFEDQKQRILSRFVSPKALLNQTKEEVQEVKLQYENLYAELAVAVLNKTKTEKQAAVERRTAEQAEADKIVAIWKKTYVEIAKSNDPDSTETRKARKAYLDAQISAGKTQVDIAKETTSEIKKEQKKQYTTMKNEIAKFEDEVNVRIANVQLKAAKGLISSEESLRRVSEIRVKGIEDQSIAYNQLKTVAEEFFGKGSNEYASVVDKLNRLDVSRTQILISEAAAQRKATLELARARNEAAILEQQKNVNAAATQGNTDLERLTSVFEAEQKLSDLRIKAKEEELRQLRAIEGTSQDDILQKENEITKLKIDNTKQITDYYKNASSERLAVAEEEYARGIISAQEYSAAVQSAWDNAAISQEDYRLKMLESSGSMWENFVEGSYTAMESVQSLNSFMQDIGSTMFESWGNGMSGAISSFIEGTKSAKDAFNDFAMSFLQEIQRMIVKQIVFNALKSVAGMSFAEGGMVPSFASGGRIPGSSPTPTADNIKINATAGEYIHPVKSVQYYGEDVMEGIRRRLIPRGLFTGLFKLPSLPSMKPKYSFATGGSIPSTNKETVSTSTEQKQPINIVNVTDPRELGTYLATSEGSNALLNVLSSKAQTIKRILR